MSVSSSRLTVLVLVGWLGMPVHAADSAEPMALPESQQADQGVASDTDIGAARAELVHALIEQGRTQSEAEMMINALTDEDIVVLAANPGMLEQAGNSTLIAWIVLLTIMIAGITLIVIANAT